ncbi:MAG: hypothetical protein CME65_13605 [Halobacteriovoraceae bacterium]|nr:hypothetical protein [Halobacteriovoraceae bacterium]|tara:strand:- start:32935 stop:34029 length:1095 start_codon:yes stop_codon:yes gene_type:complete
MEYWKTYQKDLIQTYLGLIYENETEFTLWQQIGQERRTYPVKIIEMTKTHTKLKILRLPNNDLFDDKKSIFCHIPGLDIIFKKDSFTRIGQYVDFPHPSEVQIYEKRRTRRYYYLYQDHKNITYHSLEMPNGEPLWMHSSVLVDISTSGAGMVVAKNSIKDLKTGQHLFLINLTDQKLPEPFKMEIIYIEEYNDKETGLYKVGLKFDDELDSISYQSISSIIKIKQAKSQGLNPELYCGLDFEQQTKILNNIEQKNRVLANNLRDNIEYLDKLRYMTVQMKVDFLKSIEHELLAVALRLSSKELIYELFSEVTERMQDEFLDKLQAERPASAVCKAQDDLLKVIREKESRGEIVLDPTAFITYV